MDDFKSFILTKNDEAQLHWAFNIIYAYMIKTNLDELQSLIVPIKVIKNTTGIK